MPRRRWRGNALRFEPQLLTYTFTPQGLLGAGCLGQGARVGRPALPSTGVRLIVSAGSTRTSSLHLAPVQIYLPTPRANQADWKPIAQRVARRSTSAPSRTARSRRRRRTRRRRSRSRSRCRTKPRGRPSTSSRRATRSTSRSPTRSATTRSREPAACSTRSGRERRTTRGSLT